jgi:hypothetical protein
MIRSRGLTLVTRTHDVLAANVEPGFSCCTATGKLTVNGASIAEPFINLPAGVTRADTFTFSVTVPKGDLWVMGDNRHGPRTRPTITTTRTSRP